MAAALMAGSDKTSREKILNAVRRALKPDKAADARDQLALGLRQPRANPIPARSQIPHGQQVDLFVAKASEHGASVARAATPGDVPGAVAEFLRGNNLPTMIKMAPDPWLRGMPWAEAPMLAVREGAADGDDPVGLSPALAGIAETGTLMAISGPASPTTLNFLPDTHIVVLRAQQIVGPLEDAWAALRRHLAGKPFPRTVNLITGPSRTADIAQELITGAHGPRRLHIVVVDDQTAGP
jgi:L-lactate dehydrogenase complex protein LldG